MSAISYTVAKKEYFCCSVCHYSDHLVGTDKDALYNIVEIHELVIIIAPLASTTHIQLKNLNTGQKIETVKNTQT